MEGQRPPKSSIPRGSARGRNSDMWYTSRMESSFHGYVSNTRDALLLFESVHQGLIPKSRRRLKEEESKFLRSGQVFIFDEKESGIKRWTDGLIWSPSRVLSNFLVYRQVDRKPDADPAENHPFMQPAASSSIASAYTPYFTGQKEGEGGGQADFIVPHDTNYSNFETTSPSMSSWSGSTVPHMNHSIVSSTSSGNVHSQSSSRWTNHDSPLRGPSDFNSLGHDSSLLRKNEGERGLVGSLRGSHLFAKGGLCKKTISVRLDSTTLHLVAYFTVADVRSGCLPTPSSLPQHASLSISLDRFHTSSFRIPPKIFQTHAGATMVLEDDADSPSGEEDYHQQHYTPARLAPQLSSLPNLIQHQSYPVRETAGGGAGSSADLALLYPDMLDTVAASTPHQHFNSEQAIPPPAPTAGQDFYTTGSQHVQYTNSPYAHMQPGKGIEEAETQPRLQYHHTGQQIHRPDCLVDGVQQWKASGLTQPGILDPHHHQHHRHTLVNRHPYLVQSDATGLPLECSYRPSHFMLGHQVQLDDLQPRQVLETVELQPPGGTANEINLDEPNRNQAYLGMDINHGTSGRQFLAPSLSHQSSTRSIDSPPPYWLDDASVQQSQPRLTPGSEAPIPPPRPISSPSPSHISTMAPPIMTSHRQMMISTMPVQPAGLSAFSSGWNPEAAAFTNNGPAYYSVPMSHPNDRSDQSYGPIG